eukprot:TRINITY_DN24299_c0_g1_i1.p1 TRINITY_DN24299_c0_g1~~TRINITY_DN24299_c0_g1_i1.p1  ORF type:complete len:288 (+),score=56.70 TRINITY_DN24299_c0_g1_i1:139-1002(+)
MRHRPVAEFAIDVGVGVLTIIIVFVLMLVYLLDLPIYESGKPTPPDRTPHAHQSIQQQPTENWVRFVCRSAIHKLQNPVFEDLNKFTAMNFITILLSNVSTIIEVAPHLHRIVLVALSTIEDFCYSFSKFAQTGFFILRFQLTAKSLRILDVKLVGFLWGLNLLAFLCMFAGILNDPPNILILSNEVGMMSIVVFLIADSIANIIVLYMSVSPIAMHLRVLKRQDTSNLEASLQSIHKSNNGLHDPTKIKKFERIVKVSVMTCAASITVTVMENVFTYWHFMFKPEK